MRKQTQNPDQDSWQNKNQEQPLLKESPSLTMPKLIIIASLIASIGLVFGVLRYCLTKQKRVISPAPKTISAIEISADKKSILNVETKAIIFTIADAQKYLKNSGYAYNPDTFQTTNAEYAGDCFLAATLSNSKDKIVFSTGCLAGDLPQAWIGVYTFPHGCPAGAWCKVDPIRFLIEGSGRNFVWSQDDKTITYEADLGLSGMTEMRMINAVTGEILERKNNDEIKINEFLTVKGSNIYDNNIKIGFIDGNKINIFLENRIFSFNGDINKINFFVPNEYITIFSYNDLYVSNGLYRANSINSPLEITYKCDGPLRNLENVKYNYCETNGKDYLTQYEFSDLTSSGFGTGGGTSWRWYKLYIKKINGTDYVFQGYIDDNWIEGPGFNSKEDKEKYKKLSTKDYLDGILAEKDITDKIKEWDDFVGSL